LAIRGDERITPPRIKTRECAMFVFVAALAAIGLGYIVAGSVIYERNRVGQDARP